ncbi:hypothetical protein DFH28DRAFT_909256 [Melampsora americana]|nr:hypothetical protein DFH28DRAFT_909256 [Melampsora americana]
MHEQLQAQSEELSSQATSTTDLSDSQLQQAADPDTINSFKPIAKWINSYTWDPKRMHHFCACHKLGLVVKHGLAALRINARAGPANKEAVLGRFPIVDIMPVIQEEEDENDGCVDDKNLDEDDDPDHQPDELPEEDHHSDSEEVTDYDDEDQDEATRRLCKALNDPPESRSATNNTMATLYKNCLTVCRRMTRSASWRRIFERRMKAKGLSVRPLVAGYGIRWNADHDRQSRAYEAREVIDQILNEDLAKFHSTNRRRGTDVKKAAYFHGITFDGRDWEDLNALNEELLPFLLLTKRFEENSPNGSIVLPEYSIMLDSLKKRQASLEKDDPLYPMIAEMVIWMEKYWNEALKCESLVFATILNPLFRHRFFEATFGPQDPKAVENLAAFTSAFNNRKTEHLDLDSQRSSQNKQPTSSSLTSAVSSVYQLFTHNPQAEREGELKRYLKGDHPLLPVLKDGAIDPDCILKWWKVSI